MPFNIFPRLITSKLHLSILLVAISLAQYSCRPKNKLNDQLSESFAARDDGSATMTCEKFAKVLYKSAPNILRVLGNEDFDSLLGSEVRAALNEKNETKFANQILNRVPLEWAWKRSDLTSVWITKHGEGWMPAGGMVILDRDLYPEGYYRQRAKSIPLQKLMNHSPWLEWDAANEVYIPRTDGASARLLQKLFRLQGNSSSFNLYRGGNYPELRLPSAERNPYKSKVPEGDSLIIFSSPSINTAMSWAHPSVHQSTINRNELLKAVQGNEPTVYVGFEYEYPEIAFLHTNQSLELFLKDSNSKLLCIVEKKYNDPEIKPELKKEVIMALNKGTKFCNNTWSLIHTSGFPIDRHPTVLKTATVKENGRLKLDAVADSDFEDGMVSCYIKSGMKIRYTMAFSEANNQVRIHTETIQKEWECPRGLRNNILYVDADKIDVTLEP